MKKENTAVSEPPLKPPAPETSDAEDDAETSQRPVDKWMIRECQLYKDEYKECTSIRGRFQQYFVYGEALNCNQWKKDHDNCCKWMEKQDVKAAETLIESEKVRRMERLRSHYGNTTWKKRDAPPSDWAKPLPEWMEERDKHTYLAIKAKELKGEAEVTPDEKDSFCSIM